MPGIEKKVAEDHTHIVLFDGVCNLCNGFVSFIIPRDQKALIKFAPSQSDQAKMLIERSGIDIAKANSVIYIRNGKVHLRSSAGLYILKDLGFPWRVFTVFFIIPKFLRDILYDLLAKVRYRVFGKRESCMVPTEEVRDRFL